MFYIAHSAEGSVWEKHKYLKRIDGKYYYPDSYEGGRHLSDLRKKTKRKPSMTEKEKSKSRGQLTSKGIKRQNLLNQERIKEDLSDSEVAKIAKDIISGKYGNGNEARRKALGMSAEEYEIVRKKVNEMMRGTGSKTVVVAKPSASTQTSIPEKQKTSKKKEKEKKTAKKSGGLNMDKVYRVYK